LRVFAIMNEFDLQAWERELAAWWRRLDRQPPGALRSTLCTIAEDLAQLRGRPDVDEEEARARLQARFDQLRALYDLAAAAGGASATTPA
jgi:hypothetical protein